MRDCAQFIVVGLLMALNGVPGLGQTKPSSVQIGGHEIHLGMPVVEAVSDLSSAGFRVQAVPPVDAKEPLRSWFVWGPASGADVNKFAVIHAKGNAVVGIENRTSEEGTLHDVFNALFGAASKLSKQGQNPCSIEPWSNYLSNGNVAGVRLDCAGLNISLVRTEAQIEGKATTSYEVWENIGADR